eukprot:PhF_6_TR38588/c6_g3_i2/m.57355
MDNLFFNIQKQIRSIPRGHPGILEQWVECVKSVNHLNDICDAMKQSLSSNQDRISATQSLFASILVRVNRTALSYMNLVEGCDLEGANLSNAVIQDTIMKRCNLRGSLLQSVQWSGTRTTLDGSDLTRCSFGYTTLYGHSHWVNTVCMSP